MIFLEFLRKSLIDKCDLYRYNYKELKTSQIQTITEDYMTTGSNFWDYEIWSFIITLTVLLGGMLIANILRRKVSLVKKSLIPSSVLGGFIVLLISFIYTKITNKPLIETSMLEALTYHGLGLGFVAITLVENPKERDSGSQRDVFNTGLTTVATYLLQAVVGLFITIVLFYLIGSFFASGILLPLAYGQGPGQAFNWGSNYEKLYGFENGTSFGLTVAAMGFISASIGGIVYLNVMRKRGKITVTLDGETADEDEEVNGVNEIPSSESMDKLTVQIGLVLVAYVLAYGIMMLFNVIIDTGVLGKFGVNTLQPLIWGFNFLFAVLAAILVKSVLKMLRKSGVMKRDYTNNFLQTRLSGFFFDIMVVASIAAIDLSAFTHTEFIVPLAIICVVGGVVTYVFLDRIAKDLFPMYECEFWLSMYGMLTGTASTGIILLREIDSNFKTPAATNLVYQNLYAMVFGFPLMLVLALAPQSIGKAWLTLALVTIFLLVILGILYRSRIFKKKKEKQ